MAAPTPHGEPQFTENQPRHTRRDLTRGVGCTVRGVLSFNVESMQAAAAAPVRVVERITYLPAEGEPVSAGLGFDWDAQPLEVASPIRRIASYKGQKNYAGLWWCATTNRHVAYESWVERDFVISADHDRAVVGMAAQPFRLDFVIDGEACSHVPDFFLRYDDGRGDVVDVRPDALIGPGDRVVFGETARVCEQVGWSYRRVGELPPVRLSNLRWLAGYRHRRVFDVDVGRELVTMVRGSGQVSIGELASRVGHPVAVLPSLFHLLWTHALQTRLDELLLSTESMVTENLCHGR